MNMKKLKLLHQNVIPGTKSAMVKYKVVNPNTEPWTKPWNKKFYKDLIKARKCVNKFYENLLKECSKTKLK
jgi:hypothetical protein